MHVCGCKPTLTFALLNLSAIGCMGRSYMMIRKRCSREGWTNGAVKGGVCITHGAVVKHCSFEGCANGAKKGGVCRRHGVMLEVTTMQS